MSDNNPNDPNHANRPVDPWATPSAHPPRVDSPPKPADNLARENMREIEAVVGRRMDLISAENTSLRRQLRYAQAGLALTFLATVATAFFAAPRAGVIEDTVHSKQFVLRDDTGLIRGLWEIEPGAGPRMILRDRDGRERVRFSLLSDGSPGVTLGDRDGRPRVVLGVLPDGTSNLVFADAGGTTRAVLGHSSGEATTLVLADREGFTRAGLVVDSEGEGTLTLYERGDRLSSAGPDGSVLEAMERPAASLP